MANFAYRLQQCLQNLFADRPRLASKNKHGSSHPCSRKYGVFGRWLSKIKICISEPISESYEYIQEALCTYAMHDLILITLIIARFTGTGSFLIRYSKGHTK
jgi:hypothetical protein